MDTETTTKVPVMVHVGMTPFDGDCPCTCVPFSGGKPVYCYMTRELADQVESHNPVASYAEWNGVSSDLIEPMTEAQVSQAQEALMEGPI